MRALGLLVLARSWFFACYWLWLVCSLATASICCNWILWHSSSTRLFHSCASLIFKRQSRSRQTGRRFCLLLCYFASISRCLCRRISCSILPT